MTLYLSASKHVDCFVLKFLIFSMLILLNKLLSFSFSFSQQMRCTNKHEVLFIREVLVHETWKHKHGSQE